MMKHSAKNYKKTRWLEGRWTKFEKGVVSNKIGGLETLCQLWNFAKLLKTLFLQNIVRCCFWMSTRVAV